MHISKRKNLRKEKEALNKIINMVFTGIILVSFTVSGYYNHHDINDLAYVVAIGVDVR